MEHIKGAGPYDTSDKILILCNFGKHSYEIH